MAVAELPLSGPQRRGPSPGRWIEAPAFDLAFFILSPLAGLALLLAYPVGGPILAIAAATLIGGPHYLASFSFFFWDDAKPYHRQRWVVHFVVPGLIIAFVALVAFLRIPAVLILVIYFWNAWHVSKQSCGILSIYRHRDGFFDQRHKSVANGAIISTNLCMALWNTEWYPALHGILSIPSPQAPLLLWQASAAVAAAFLFALAVSLYRRCRRGAPPGAVESAFLVTSLTLFHPYLWVKDNNLATLGMLMGHFIQYLGIVWLVNSRKFAGGSPSPSRQYMARLWREPRLLVAVFVLIGSLFLLLQLQAMAVSITLVLLHFYLDGVFWAFRRPEVRKVLGPYLTGWKGGGAPALEASGPMGARPLV